MSSDDILRGHYQGLSGFNVPDLSDTEPFRIAFGHGVPSLWALLPVAPYLHVADPPLIFIVSDSMSC